MNKYQIDRIVDMMIDIIYFKEKGKYKEAEDLIEAFVVFYNTRYGKK